MEVWTYKESDSKISSDKITLDKLGSRYNQSIIQIDYQCIVYIYLF